MASGSAARSEIRNPLCVKGVTGTELGGEGGLRDQAILFEAFLGCALDYAPLPGTCRRADHQVG